jgi:hypothetical protein
MQEQDELLADIIRQMREDRGRSGGFDDSRFRERVEVLSPDLSLQTLTQVINTLCLDKLGVTWDERFGELVAYKKRFAHCNVPKDWSENPHLGSWVANQRIRKAILSKDCIQRLNQIGFVWEPYNALWEERFSELLVFKVTQGHCDVPYEWTDNQKLGIWVRSQRANKKKDTLSEDRIQRLNQIGFVWDTLDASWEKKFAELKAFSESRGHCNVPTRWHENLQLATWVAGQRRCRKENTLTKDRIQRLDQIGFIWDARDALWEEKFAELQAYKKAQGNCNVPQDWSENPQLAEWVTNQRQFKKKGKLSEDRIQRLDEIGLVWDTLDASWEKMFAALVIYKDINGHCNVPHLCSKNPKLGKWVHKQRQKRRNSQLSEERICRLDQIGFLWDILDAWWEEKFAELLAYKEINGHCNVPRHCKNQGLGGWVTTQRTVRKTGLLSEERIQRLNQIGFVWDILDASWEEKFAELLAYKEINGHCKVPVKGSEHPQLGSWVDRQRLYRKEGKLSEERIQRLDEIGFVWNLKYRRRSQC